MGVLCIWDLKPGFEFISAGVAKRRYKVLEMDRFTVKLEHHKNGARGEVVMSREALARCIRECWRVKN